MLLQVDRQVAAHAALALRRYRRDLARDGGRPPSGFADLLHALEGVTTGQDGSPVAAPAVMPDPDARVPRERVAFTVDELACAMGVSESTVKRCVRDGTLPSFTIGRRRLIAVEAVATWIEKRTER